MPKNDKYTLMRKKGVTKREGTAFNTMTRWSLAFVLRLLVLKDEGELLMSKDSEKTYRARKKGICRTNILEYGHSVKKNGNGKLEQQAEMSFTTLNTTCHKSTVDEFKRPRSVESAVLHTFFL